MSDNGYFQNATTKGDDKGQEILYKLFQSGNPMSNPTDKCITCGGDVIVHSSDEGTGHYEPINRNPMTTTAEELKLKIVDTRLDIGMSAGQMLSMIEEYARLYHQEKLSEASVPYFSRYDFDIDGCREYKEDGEYVAYDDVSPVMASQQAEIAQLQAEKERMESVFRNFIRSYHLTKDWDNYIEVNKIDLASLPEEKG